MRCNPSTIMFKKCATSEEDLPKHLDMCLVHHQTLFHLVRVIISQKMYKKVNQLRNTKR